MTSKTMSFKHKSIQNNGGGVSLNPMISSSAQQLRRKFTNHNNHTRNHNNNSNTTSSFSGPSLHIGTKLPNPPSFLHRGRLQFIIMDAPTDNNLFLYVKELVSKSVSLIVRTCEPTYSSDSKMLTQNHIAVIELKFPDGHPPSVEIVDEWLNIVEENLKQHNSAPIAVHCVAGLGRAPVLVAIALMEKQNMLASDAIALIRTVRRGAINQKQYEYLKSYDLKRKKHECCVIL